jgi:UDP-galactopyranose mutase
MYKEEADKFENLILVGRLTEYTEYRYYDIGDAIKRALEVFEERVKWLKYTLKTGGKTKWEYQF